MKPSQFPQANKDLTAPAGMEESCGTLPVFTDGEWCISRWRPSWRDRLRILFGGPVWLWVLSGSTQSPVDVSTAFPFEAPR